MSLFVTDYDPLLNIVTVGGVAITGIQDSIKVSQKEDKNSIVTDLAGTTSVFVTNNDEQASISFTLMESSLSNAYLEGLLLLNQKVPITISNLSNLTGCFAPQCKMLKRPDQGLGKDAPVREYTFITPKILPKA